MTAPASQRVAHGLRSVQRGVLWNAGLATVKLVAGVVGNTYALIADAVESMADVFTSAIVYQGLRVSARAPDEEYPFGYGKAEALSAAVVALTLLGAAAGIAVQAIREIRTPHLAPAPWTLLVLVGVIVVKLTLSRQARGVGVDTGSTAVRAEALHHLSDAVTSAAAFAGIGLSLVATELWPGTHWESADDWAALLASLVIAYNGVAIARAAATELMDRAPGQDVIRCIREAAEGVPGVLATEKIAVRKAGVVFRVTLHVQASPAMSLHEAHVLGGKVKTAIRSAEPRVDAVLVHLEPFEDGAAA
ncbi:MAG: cation diffusion facilitator family transporter [Gemmatimonadales bacterium]